MSTWEVVVEVIRSEKRENVLCICIKMLSNVGIFNNSYHVISTFGGVFAKGVKNISTIDMGFCCRNMSRVPCLIGCYLVQKG